MAKVILKLSVIVLTAAVQIISTVERQRKKN